MKVVINRCLGGFGLSELALRRLGAVSEYGIVRSDPKLVAVVEQLGSEKASAKHAKLAVVEIPDDVDWEIDDRDGYERVVEKHRSWP